jgi:membrane-associated protein
VLHLAALHTAILYTTAPHTTVLHTTALHATALHATTPASSALNGQLNDFIAHSGVVLFYLLVWGLVFSGTALFVGVVIPFLTGDTMLFTSGIVAATPAASHAGVDIWVLAVGTGIAAFAGDQVGFVLGRRLGRPALERHGGRRTRALIAKADWFYRTFGWWSVVIARFVPWGRVVIPVIAGVAKMAYWRFVTANLVGTLVWAVGITIAGYYAASIPAVKSVTYAVALVCIVASVVAGVRAWRADRRERRAAEVRTTLSASAITTRAGRRRERRG